MVRIPYCFCFIAKCYIVTKLSFYASLKFYVGLKLCMLIMQSHTHVSACVHFREETFCSTTQNDVYLCHLLLCVVVSR